MQFEFCQHFASISFCFVSFTSFFFSFFFSPNPKCKASFSECKAGCNLSQNTQCFSAALAPVILGTFAHSGQNPGCLVRLSQSAL